MGAYSPSELLSLQVPAALRAGKACGCRNPDGLQIPAGKSGSRRLPVPECIVPLTAYPGICSHQGSVSVCSHPSKRSTFLRLTTGGFTALANNTDVRWGSKGPVCQLSEHGRTTAHVRRSPSAKARAGGAQRRLRPLPDWLLPRAPSPGSLR